MAGDIRNILEEFYTKVCGKPMLEQNLTEDEEKLIEDTLADIAAVRPGEMGAYRRVNSSIYNDQIRDALFEFGGYLGDYKSYYGTTTMQSRTNLALFLTHYKGRRINPDEGTKYHTYMIDLATLSSTTNNLPIGFFETDYILSQIETLIKKLKEEK